MARLLAVTYGAQDASALARPLVWDQGQQTAIQAPDGGTKLSWDVWPVRCGTGRQRLEVVADGDLDDEIARLVGLGATHLATTDDGRRRPRRSRRVGAPPDRKSTRLNSSHVKIS